MSVTISSTHCHNVALWRG